MMKIEWNDDLTEVTLTKGLFTKRRTVLTHDGHSWVHKGTSIPFREPWIGFMSSNYNNAKYMKGREQSAELWEVIYPLPMASTQPLRSMTKPFLVVLLGFLVGLAIFSQSAHCAPVGQNVIYRYDSSHVYDAVVTADLGSDEVNLVVFSNGSTWYNSVSSSVPVMTMYDVYKGTTDNRWNDNANVPVQGPQGPQGEQGPQGDPGSTGPGALVTGTSTPSFSLGGSAIQLDTTHDTILTMSVSISLPLSVIAGATGTVHLFCDSSSTPTTEVETVSRGNAGGLLTTDTSTLSMLYRVPASHYCKVTSTQDVGSPTFSIVRQVKQTLGN